MIKITQKTRLLICEKMPQSTFRIGQYQIDHPVHILIFQIQSTLSFRFISVGFIFKANVKKEFFLAEMYVSCYTAIQLQTM